MTSWIYVYRKEHLLGRVYVRRKRIFRNAYRTPHACACLGYRDYRYVRDLYVRMNTCDQTRISFLQRMSCSQRISFLQRMSCFSCVLTYAARMC